MTEMKAPGALAVLNPSTVTDPDAFWVAFLLSRASPARAHDFARAMAERTAWNIEVDWHDHWNQVAALLVTENQAEPELDARP
jgi:hypothetical protein